MTGGFLRHPLLEGCGVEHGFGVRGAPEPPGLRRPRQVHGAKVARIDARGARGLEAADAVISDVPHVPIGVQTADCVPVLLATPSGRTVAAVHAGWRGLAHGVITAALCALAEATSEAAEAVAVVGPHVGRCCYEVDGPVVEALAPRFGAALDAVRQAVRPGHWMLDLGAAVRFELERAGFAAERIAALGGTCTACDAQRFHSYRRDGPRAGRLVHFVAARPGGLDTARGAT